MQFGALGAGGRLAFSVCRQWAVAAGPAVGGNSNLLVLTAGTAGVQLNAYNNSGAIFALDNSGHAIFYEYMKPKIFTAVSLPTCNAGLAGAV